MGMPGKRSRKETFYVALLEGAVTSLIWTVEAVIFLRAARKNGLRRAVAQTRERTGRGTVG